LSRLGIINSEDTWYKAPVKYLKEIDENNEDQPCREYLNGCTGPEWLHLSNKEGAWFPEDSKLYPESWNFA
jgi:hypothetical protein